MKTTLTSLLLATALCGAPAAFATIDGPARATATIEMINPEKFTDFRLSPLGSPADTQALTKEFQREVNRQAGNLLPAGWHVILRVTDFDMAGEFEPQRRPPNDEVRIMRGVYTPKITLEYSVTNAAGQVVASGQRRLTDLNYEYRLRIPNPGSDQLAIEVDMVGDFFRELARSAG